MTTTWDAQGRTTIWLNKTCGDYPTRSSLAPLPPPPPHPHPHPHHHHHQNQNQNLHLHLNLNLHQHHHFIIWLCLKIRSPNPMVLSVNFRQLDIIAWPYWRVHTIFRQRHIDAGYDNYESINCHSDRCFPSWLRRSSWRTETGQRKSLEVSPSTYGPFKIGWLIGFGIGSYTTKVIGDCNNPDSRRRTAGWFQVLGTFPYICIYI